MKVWMLFRGEEYEGGSVQGLYTTREVALKSAESYMREHTYEGTEYPWISNPHAGMEDWWHSGCDYLYIKEVEVSEEPSNFEEPPARSCPVCGVYMGLVSDVNVTVGEVLDGRCDECKRDGRCLDCDTPEGPIVGGRCRTCRERASAEAGR